MKQRRARANDTVTITKARVPVESSTRSVSPPMIPRVVNDEDEVVSSDEEQDIDAEEEGGSSNDNMSG